MLLKILKDDAIKVQHSVCHYIWKTQQWPQDWKGSILISALKKGSTKECSNYWKIAFISHASKAKILQLGFSIARTKNFQMFKLGLEKVEESEIKLSTFIASWRSKGILGKKKYTSASLTMLKPLTG